jgi:hypothetical protein
MYATPPAADREPDEEGDAPADEEVSLMTMDDGRR